MSSLQARSAPVGAGGGGAALAEVPVAGGHRAPLPVSAVSPRCPAGFAGFCFPAWMRFVHCRVPRTFPRRVLTDPSVALRAENTKQPARNFPPTYGRGNPRTLVLLSRFFLFKPRSSLFLMSPVFPCLGFMPEYLVVMPRKAENPVFCVIGSWKNSPTSLL